MAPRAGSTFYEPPPEWRCQRVVALRTGGITELWRCGKRVREMWGYCQPHRDLADARLLAAFDRREQRQHGGEE